MVHTTNLDSLKQAVEDIKWHREQIAKSEATLKNLCVFDYEGNGRKVKDVVFESIAAAFSGKTQLTIPVNPHMSLSMFPTTNDQVLAVVQVDDKVPDFSGSVWCIENLGEYLDAYGYLSYFDNISKEDFVTSVLIASLKY